MSDAYAFVKRRKVGNASAKLVLFAIAEYTDEKGVSQPSARGICETTELSRRTVTAALDLLAEKGIIKRERSTTAKGHRQADKITLLGYQEWLQTLGAEFAPRPNAQDLRLGALSAEFAPRAKVQDLHLGFEDTPPLVVVSAPEPQNTLSAKFAPSFRQIEINSSKSSSKKEDLFYVEGAVPKRRSKAQSAEVERITEAMWFTWPPVARKRHTRKQVSDAIEAELRKGVARGDDLIAAGKRHVAERMQSDAHFVKGLVPFIAKGLWANWAEEDAPYEAPVAEGELKRRLMIFEHDGYWQDSWGPKPSRENTRSAA